MIIFSYINNNVSLNTRFFAGAKLQNLCHENYHFIRMKDEKIHCIKKTFVFCL